MTAIEFRGPGFSDEQWEQLRTLSTSLDSRQLLWVSGFLAGVEHAKSPQESSIGSPSGDSSALPSSASAKRRLTVLYGSETGNSTALAQTLADRAKARGIAVSLHDMANYKTRQLKDEQDLLIIASTYGEGDPPQPATGFFEFLEGRKAPKLPDLRFAVLALGDSSYEFFCEAGKRLDRRLEELQALRLKPRLDCDIDYDDAAAVWIAEILESVDATSAGSTPVTTLFSSSPQSTAGTPVFDKRKPFPARVIDNIVLTGRGSSKETRHIELSIEGSGLNFEPGDALGLLPNNNPALIEQVLAELDLAPTAQIKLKDSPVALSNALASSLEITTLTPRFIQHWASLCGADSLKRLTLPEHTDERLSFVRNHHVIDVLRQFPVKGIEAQNFVDGLRPLQPRLYSIASSTSATPDEVHLTVSTVRYQLHDEWRSGVASSHLAERADLDADLPIYIQHNPHFRLPADDVPIIMIGAGTGVAPYRSFMQERETRNAAGRSWLFFGERNLRTDFLYQTEWQAQLKDQILTRMDVAFSRDKQGHANGKTYVQHRLQEHARDIFAWLEEGAHLYVCGDASRLAPDVHQALTNIVASEGKLGADATHEYLLRLQNDSRYQRDVY